MKEMMAMIDSNPVIVRQIGRISRGKTILNIIFLLLVLGTLLPFYSCEKDETISIPRDYSQWERTTTIELDYPIPGHENNYRIIYINEIGESPEVETQKGKNRITFPEGTMIVKEVYSGFDYTPGDQPTMLTIMVKASDDPRNRGGWLWIVNNVEQGTQRILESEFCITCHNNANEQHPYGDTNPNEEYRDYVFFIPRLP